MLVTMSRQCLERKSQHLSLCQPFPNNLVNANFAHCQPQAKLPPKHCYCYKETLGHNRSLPNASCAQSKPCICCCMSFSQMKSSPNTPQQVFETSYCQRKKYIPSNDLLFLTISGKEPKPKQTNKRREGLPHSHNGTSQRISQKQHAAQCLYFRETKRPVFPYLHQSPFFHS